MSNVAVQLLVLLLLLVANGVFAAAELSIASSRKVRLQQRAEAGDAGARAALDLASEPGRFLSTVQIGITLISILTGAFGGSSLGAFFGTALEQVPLLAPISAQLGVFLAILVITYLSLIIGELVPKQLALGNPEAIAARVAGPMGRLSVFASPMVWLLSRSTALILRLLGSKPSTEPAVTEEEITILVQQGAQAGVFEAAEREIVDRVFRLGDQRVADLMVPRPRVVWIDIADPTEESLRRMAEGGYTHYPVCRGDLDHVLGIVSVRELWARQTIGQPADIESALHPPLYLPETVTAYQALEQFKTSGSRIALVIDEYGGVEGLITLGDLLGDLVGDGVPPVGAAGAIRRTDGSWLVDGMLPLDEFRDFIPVDELPGEELGYFQTLGGFVLAQLGRLPEAGDRVTWGGYDFEVMDMDGQRVDKVLVQETKMPTEGKTE
jgi:putative hemolysin